MESLYANNIDIGTAITRAVKNTLPNGPINNQKFVDWLNANFPPQTVNRAVTMKQRIVEIYTGYERCKKLWTQAARPAHAHEAPAGDTRNYVNPLKVSATSDDAKRGEFEPQDLAKRVALAATICGVGMCQEFGSLAYYLARGIYPSNMHIAYVWNDAMNHFFAVAATEAFTPDPGPRGNIRLRETDIIIDPWISPNPGEAVTSADSIYRPGTKYFLNKQGTGRQPADIHLDESAAQAAVDEVMQGIAIEAQRAYQGMLAAVDEELQEPWLAREVDQQADVMVRHVIDGSHAPPGFYSDNRIRRV